MKSVSTEWIRIYKKIIDSINSPVLILNSSSEIISSNEKANSLFLIDESISFLEQIFKIETVEQLSGVFSKVLSENKKEFIGETLVQLKSGSLLNYNATIDCLELNDNKYVCLFFRSENADQSEQSLEQINIQNENAVINLNDEPIKKLFYDIKAQYPITLVGKKKIQVIIDQFEDPVWIKDDQGRFILINKSYARNLGIESSQAEGKTDESYLPSHLAQVFRSVDQFILNSHSSVIIEGFRRKIFTSEVVKRIIQIPLTTNLNQIFAVFGVVKEVEAGKNKNQENFILGTEFIHGIPKPVVIFDNGGYFKQCNEEFSKFIGSKSEELLSKRFVDIFSFLISENIRSFIESEIKEDEIYVDKDLNPVESFSCFAKFYLKKISIKTDLDSGLIIFIDEVQKEEEPQNLIKTRGRMFDILIQKNPDPIFIYNKEDLCFLEVNEAAIKLYGYSRDEFLQMDLTDLYSPEDIQTLLDSFNLEALEGRFSKPFRHRKKDGSTILVEISKTSFQFNDKEAHFNIVKDITDSFEKEKQNQMLKAIFESTDDLVFNTDASGFIAFINRPVSEKLGYTKEELIKSSFASLVPDEDRGLVNTSIFQTHLKDTVNLNIQMKKADGHYVDTEISATPVIDFDGETDSFTILVKLHESVLSQEKPEKVVKEIIKDVIVEKPIHSVTNQSYPDSSFLSGMFHEILTPMNVIIGFSQELVDSIKEPSLEQKESADIINQNRIKLMDAMNAVVEYSEIIQNKYTLTAEDISITQIIEKLDKDIKEITGINDIQFGYGKISSSLNFQSDRQKFENLIFYLIKVVSRLSKDKKVYFSSYALEYDLFLISISDQYGSSSEYVSDIIDKIFSEDKDPKDYGLPKLTTSLAKTLLSLLGGKFHKSVSGSMRNESGFVFPLTISSKSQSLFEELPSVSSDTSIDGAKVSDEIGDRKTKVENLPKTEEIEKPVSEEIPAAKELQKDIFEEVPPIATELLSKISDQTEETTVETPVTEQIELPNEEVEKALETNKASNVEETESTDLAEALNVTEDEVKEERPAPIPKSLDLSKLRCLYIEDQVDSQILFKVQMKGLKDVKFAVSFEESQPLLVNHNFDFIVMDINLQGEYNGLDALKIIRTMPAYQTIPVIAVTAYVLPGDKEKFIAAGFDDFVSKPIFREKMIESMEVIFLNK
jgi:PAS domain S-box-containing protein